MDSRARVACTCTARTATGMSPLPYLLAYTESPQATPRHAQGNVPAPLPFLGAKGNMPKPLPQANYGRISVQQGKTNCMASSRPADVGSRWAACLGVGRFLVGWLLGGVSLVGSALRREWRGVEVGVGWRLRRLGVAEGLPFFLWKGLQLRRREWTAQRTFWLQILCWAGGLVLAGGRLVVLSRGWALAGA